jgi:hypothetical protein
MLQENADLPFVALDRHPEPCWWRNCKHLRGGIALLRTAGRRSDDAKVDTDRAASVPPSYAARGKQAALETDLKASSKRDRLTAEPSGTADPHL